MFALRYTRLVALGALLVAAGCGNTGSGADGGNCAANPAGCICHDDGNCGGVNPRCNSSNGQCVPCLPTNDNCAQGQHCVKEDGNYKCVGTGICITAVDCPKKTPNAAPACCNGACVDNTNADKENCGGCGAACPTLPNSQPVCIGGACAIDHCDTGFDNCDGSATNGCETNVAGDVRHCGNCATVCSSGGNSTPVCTAGKCLAGCVAGFMDCDGNLGNGCEVSIDTDARNCGACGKACGALQNAATVICKGGMCTAGSCSGWYGDCDNNPANGCEADTQGEAANCGGCGKPCAAVANGTPGCGNGTCTVAKCNAGYGNCDNEAKNGCEVRTSSDALNCGMCGNPCSGSNSQQSCSNGSCVVAACNQGFADCDMKANNGCEVNVLSDALNCNGCGMACPTPTNTIPICKLGVCSVGGCKPGFADCNKDPADGCEVDVTTTSNCGACNVQCAVPANAVAACRNGVCGIGMCNGGFADCDQNVGNGCEVNTQANNNNCGICGLVCVPPMGGNIGNQCMNAKCMIGGCIPGYADCDGNKADCESNVNGDAKNCGGCGIVCPMNTPFCASGKCGTSIHGSVAWPNAPYPYVGNSCNMTMNGVLIGNFQAINVGQLTWKDCMIEASKRNAMVTSPTYGNWPLPGWWASRQPQGFQPNLAMTGQWANYITADIGTKQNCNIMHEPQSVALNQFNSKPNQLANTTAYDGNTWHYQDMGQKYIDECTLLAGQYGASIITPWTIGLQNGDNYWQGILHTCSVYSWSAGNGTNFGYDNTTTRVSIKGCMLGWIDG